MGSREGKRTGAKLRRQIMITVFSDLAFTAGIARVHGLLIGCTKQVGDW